MHVLLSAVLKLMRVVRIPAGLALYRGLGGRLDLPSSFKAADGDGLYGYAEWGFLSTTSSREVAVQVRPASVARSRGGARIPLGSVLCAFAHLTRIPCFYILMH